MKMPRLLTFVLIFHLFLSVEFDPWLSTIWSKVECTVAPVGTHCPRGSYYADGECLPYPKESPRWSFSMHCADKDIVQDRGAKVLGPATTISSSMSLFCFFVIGPVLDVVGRKPILLLGLGTLNVFLALMYIGCLSDWSTFVVFVYVGSFIEAASKAENIAAKAVCADLSHGNAELCGEGFAALNFATNLSLVLGNVVGVPILAMKLDDYTWVWATFTLISFLFFFVSTRMLKETMESGARSQSCGLALRSGLSQVVDGFRLGCRDIFLGQVILISTLVSVGSSAGSSQSFNYLTNYLNYSQAQASLLRVFIPLASCVGCGAAPWFFRMRGLRLAFGGGVALITIGFVMCGMGGPLPDAAAILYWFGMVLVGFGSGLAFTAQATILSLHAPESSQGTVFSVFAVVSTVAGQANILWTNVLFEAGSIGWRAGVPFFAGAGLVLVALVWFAILHLLYPQADCVRRSRVNSISIVSELDTMN